MWRGTLHRDYDIQDATERIHPRRIGLRLKPFPFQTKPTLRRQGLVWQGAASAAEALRYRS